MATKPSQAQAPNPDKGKAKRTRKPSVLPELPKLEAIPNGPGKEQFQRILSGMQSFLNSFKETADVPVDTLRIIRKYTNVAATQHLRTRRVDPEAKKLAKKKERFLKLQQELKELGAI